jgi:GNAT superfamily N-acetyltransferase
MQYAVARAAPYLTWDAEDEHIPTDVYYCDQEPGRDWSEPMLEWHFAATSWIPRELLGWWLPWFDREEYLDSMSLGWWRARGVAIVAAKDGDTFAGVGVLTKVIADEGWQAGFPGSSELAYEIRSVVVAPEYRRRGVFTRLCRELVDEAVRLSRPRQAEARHWTFIASRNPSLQRRFLWWRSELNEAQRGELDAILTMSCWNSKRLHPPCRLCPRVLGNAFAWPTHALRATWS